MSYQFAERYPYISLRNGDAFSISRAAATTVANMKEYY